MVRYAVFALISLTLVAGCTKSSDHTAMSTNATKPTDTPPPPPPTLASARFVSVTGHDNKDKDTGVYVYVYTKDSKTKLAQIENADNSDKDATEYNDGSTHSIDLSVLSASLKQDCVGFSFKIGSKANGNDNWELSNARVELHFTDNTNLNRETGGFSLNSRGSGYTEKAF